MTLPSWLPKVPHKGGKHCFTVSWVNSATLASFLPPLLNIIHLLSLKTIPDLGREQFYRAYCASDCAVLSFFPRCIFIYSFVLVSESVVAERNTACIQRTVDYHCCRFPFRYKGVKYKKCTNNGDAEGRFWCATEDVRHRSNETTSWGYCKCKLPLNLIDPVNLDLKKVFSEE